MEKPENAGQILLTKTKMEDAIDEWRWLEECPDSQGSKWAVEPDEKMGPVIFRETWIETSM